MTIGPGPGDAVGGYRVLRVLGHGGMGVVLEAYDPGLRRRVALKVIAPHLAGDASYRSRFTREARALAALDSPHVVQVHDYGEEEGRLHLVTQLVPDGDLGALLRRAGALRPGAAVGLVAQVASGLADAHAAGLVHRDIKPANVLLRRRGEAWHAYLCDFGVARQVGHDDDGATGAGTVGTPSYMAPELHTGAEAGVASDVYSLGCLLWAALTGRPPYVGSSELEVVTAHREQPVPQLAGATPGVAATNRVLRRALAKDPADRYPSAARLRDDLRAAAALLAPPARVVPAEPARRGRSVAALAVLGVVLTAAGVALASPWAGDTLRADSTAAMVTADLSPSPSRPASLPLSPGSSRGTTPVEKATASLADALRAAAGLTRTQAECAARRWVGAAGLRAMADAGLFDGEWRFVDQDRTAMSPAMVRAATRAALPCAARR